METSNSVLEAWWTWMVHSTWQVALFAAIIWALTSLFTKTSASFRYALWFMVFLKLLKKTTASDIPINLTSSGENGTFAAAEGGEGEAGAGWRKDAKAGVVTVEVLNALIKENPANMTQAVRSWLAAGNKSN